MSKPVRGERARWMRFLNEEVWPKVDPEFLGKPLSKEEMDKLAGYGPEGL
jgi:antitoxin VapB